MCSQAVCNQGGNVKSKEEQMRLAFLYLQKEHSVHYTTLNVIAFGFRHQIHTVRTDVKKLSLLLSLTNVIIKIKPDEIMLTQSIQGRQIVSVHTVPSCSHTSTRMPKVEILGSCQVVHNTCNLRTGLQPLILALVNHTENNANVSALLVEKEGRALLFLFTLIIHAHIKQMGREMWGWGGGRGGKKLFYKCNSYILFSSPKTNEVWYLGNGKWIQQFGSNRDFREN